ncbi:MAG: pyruvate kinase [Sphingobacteriales bacterium 17-39-43]|jgi:pyruvate kinase|uniref:pyruvate kinase n=1 Tax=Daejeonella sp. TaxID=2805397 RepID=UPI000BD25FD6|nr:pyruvate kinase [Daejeonella sp.]OYZ28445.1 MAG: pyruvate kinase [Sphingobacteriales bacterium 16-39-50]OYZ55817.1 MAG: pyruvate kinase [Sphingobacteriales bacterium 24-40-4]OZA22059.1 MAG: pyruvate kinase [Sphingobacteriales bacterium 17-39-43]OZA55559.1 MAG: pyruvate kinase [Sphingobacteriales bacterium 39-40-5]HQS05207.1 pyruvate kinase [Daejeonella sp.]
MKTVHNRTKIVATLGPASAKKEVLLNMIKAGVDVCRLNFSHGKAEDHQKVIDIIRDINKKYKTNVGILADLQGPKIRIGLVKDGGINLISGHKIEITTKELIGDDKQIYITYQSFPSDVRSGEIILLDDGKIQMRVLSTNNKDSVQCEVVYGGILTSRKGVNLPNTKVSIPSLTEEDLANLEFALNNDVEWIGLSFVRSADDIIELKRIIARSDKTARVIAKIEKPEAIDNIDEIIEATDGVMVARGDLGVEMPMEQVPLLQKMIARKCRAASKPVIVATQMLESMITSPRPTRAEVNDVANSVLDGADAVMLSGETSVGEYPLIVIETMHKIVRNVEENDYPYNTTKVLNESSPTYMGDAVCGSAVFLAEKTHAVGIISMTSSGYTAFEISSYRPKAATFIFTSNRKLLNTLSLLWGVRGFYYDKFDSTDKTIRDVNQILKAEKLVEPGNVVINTAAIPIEKKGKTNMIKVTIVD